MLPGYHPYQVDELRGEAATLGAELHTVEVALAVATRRISEAEVTLTQTLTLTLTLTLTPTPTLTLTLTHLVVLGRRAERDDELYDAEAPEDQQLAW